MIVPSSATMRCVDPSIPFQIKIVKNMLTISPIQILKKRDTKKAQFHISNPINRPGLKCFKSIDCMASVIAPPKIGLVIGILGSKRIQTELNL